MLTRSSTPSVVSMAMGPDDEIDHDAPLTPYRQLAEILRARIARGDWAPGRAIASEAQLVQQYGLARTTVRRAIAALVESGDVFTVPQRGTYVSESSGGAPGSSGADEA
jgi:GntR family transcriptional regulator